MAGVTASLLGVNTLHERSDTEPPLATFLREVRYIYGRAREYSIGFASQNFVSRITSMGWKEERSSGVSKARSIPGKERRGHVSLRIEAALRQMSKTDEKAVEEPCLAGVPGGIAARRIIQKHLNMSLHTQFSAYSLQYKRFSLSGNA